MSSNVKVKTCIVKGCFRLGYLWERINGKNRPYCKEHANG